MSQIGDPVRVIEVQPAVLPIPEHLPDPLPEEREPAPPKPEREPVPA